MGKINAGLRFEVKAEDDDIAENEHPAAAEVGPTMVGLGDTLSPPGNESQKLALVAIDEAHHIHEQGDLQQIVDKYAPKGQSLTRLMLLSDASQSAAIEMAPEFDATEVRLEEVVRSTQRIIAGAAMFGKTGHGVVASHQVTWAILY